LQSIATRAKRCIHRKEFANLFVMFPILKHLAAMKSEFERTMEGCDPAIRGQYSIILNTLHSTVSYLHPHYVSYFIITYNNIIFPN
jgi:exocyst complex component 7